MKNYQSFTVKFLGPTENKGARVKITDNRFKKSKTIEYDYEKNTIEDNAIAYLEGRGFGIVGLTLVGGQSVLLSNGCDGGSTFKSITCDR